MITVPLAALWDRLTLRTTIAEKPDVGTITLTWRRFSGRLLCAAVQPEGMAEQVLSEPSKTAMFWLAQAGTPTQLSLRARYIQHAETRRLAEQFAGVTT